MDRAESFWFVQRYWGLRKPNGELVMTWEFMLDGVMENKGYRKDHPMFFDTREIARRNNPHHYKIVSLQMRIWEE